MTLKIPKVPVGSKYQVISFNRNTYKMECEYCKTEEDMMKLKEKYSGKEYTLRITKLN